MNRTSFRGKGKRVEFPFREAFWMSLEQIRKRLKRSIILVGSIALGISLLTHLEMTNVILATYMSSIGSTMEAYQFWLIIVSLFVCGIGLINANLIAIYERYREIGTMKCLGAMDQHVMKLFLIESLIFGAVGGVLGFSFGTITAIASSSVQLGINALSFTPLEAILRYLAISTGLSVLLSVISTMYPALRAARLNPVEALRHNI
ncbi:MAG: FtsX-like permease family protein [Candidatus Bathyarchaeia archaeon]